MRYLYDKDYVGSVQKTGVVVLSGVMGMYFLGEQDQFHDQKVIYSWAEIVHEAEQIGSGLRIFVDLQKLFHNNIIEELRNCKSEINLAVHRYGKSIFPLKIVNGCLEPDVVRLESESLRFLQQHHNCVYVIPT